MRKDKQPIPDEAPEWLNSEAKKLWAPIVNALTNKGVLEPHHIFWCELLVSTFAHWRQASERYKDPSRDSKERTVYAEVAADFLPTLREMISDVGFDSVEEFDDFLRRNTH
jgi:phage terminase small subunit